MTSRRPAARPLASRAKDYAAALGGQLSGVEHIAGPGLIGCGATERWVALCTPPIRTGLRHAHNTGTRPPIITWCLPPAGASCRRAGLRHGRG